MTSEACQRPGLWSISVRINFGKFPQDRLGQELVSVTKKHRMSSIYWDLMTHQLLEPSPQIGKCMEASVRVVPRIPASDDLDVRLCWFLTNRCPSKVSGSGYWDTSCMSSQAGTHAIWPTATCWPVLWKTYGCNALRRMPTVQKEGRTLLALPRIIAEWQKRCLLLSSGLSRTDSLKKLSRIGSCVIVSWSTLSLIPSISLRMSVIYSGRAHSSRNTKWRFYL